VNVEGCYKNPRFEVLQFRKDSFLEGPTPMPQLLWVFEVRNLPTLGFDQSLACSLPLLDLFLPHSGCCGDDVDVDVDADADPNTDANTDANTDCEVRKKYCLLKEGGGKKKVFKNYTKTKTGVPTCRTTRRGKTCLPSQSPLTEVVELIS
jgi:hypothetical protein